MHTRTIIAFAGTLAAMTSASAAEPIVREVKDGLEIKPGETVELKPGGYHVMFVGLKEPLKQGEDLTVTLKFAKAGTVEVKYPVEAVGAGGPAAGHGMNMKMDKMGH